MFWDKAASFYDLFEKAYNGSVNRRLTAEVAAMIGPDDEVLECACGTGMLTRAIAQRCKSITAVDYSEGMLKQAKKKCAAQKNISFEKADITDLRFPPEEFDKVVAGNVIHLLDRPEPAMREMFRTCRRGGKVIVPTYVNCENNGKTSLFIRILERFGANFHKQFDYHSYRIFFEKMGFTNGEYTLIEGKMPCAIAVFTKENI